MKIAHRIITWLRITEPELFVQLSDRERQALDFIKSAEKSPSEREISKLVGLSSSRSGHRLVESLIRKGVVRRDAEGRLLHASPLAA